MLAYKVQPDGYGYSANIPDSSNKFFWSQLTAGKFCEQRLGEHIRASVRRYTEQAEFNGFYNTIRKYNALFSLNNFIREQPTQSLLQLANQVIALEADMRSMLPGSKHPRRFEALQQVNEIVWLCIRIRKQFKTIAEP